MLKNIDLVITDIYISIKKYRLIHELAWSDIKQRYRRTILGPLWISLSISATILGLGILFGVIFKQKNITYLPYLAVGIIFWTFISGVISEGAESFIAMQNVIKQISLPYSIYVFRVIYRNVIMLLHNLVLALIIFNLLDIKILFFNVYVIPQFIAGMINLFWIASILAVISTRYRDISPIVSNCLQLFFYLTPIIWMTEQVENNELIQTILRYNPFYYILIALRSLMDGNMMAPNQIWVLGSMAITGIILSFALFCINYKRIAFWL